jgi:hypothetical protein
MTSGFGVIHKAHQGRRYSSEKRAISGTKSPLDHRRRSTKQGLSSFQIHADYPSKGKKEKERKKRRSMAHLPAVLGFCSSSLYSLIACGP